MHNRLQNHFKTDKGRTDARSVAEAEEAQPEMVSQDNLAWRATRSLASHPAIAIGAAFAVGLLVGKWVKR